MHFTLTRLIAVIIAACSAPASVIFLKLSSDAWVPNNPWFPLAKFLEINGNSVLYFALANVVGFLNPICTTIVLRDSKPNVVYATISAPATILVHLSLALYFKNPLTVWQWLAIGVIVFGTILLQWRFASGEEEAVAEVIHELVDADTELHE